MLFVSSDFDRSLSIWKQLPGSSAATPDIVMRRFDQAPWDMVVVGNEVYLAGGNSVFGWKDIEQTIEYLLSLDCPIDAFELNLLTIKDDSDGRHGNKMGNDPKKYGYTVEDKQWKNNQMDRKEANIFLNTIKNDPLVKNKRKFMSATYIGRIMSLGYTIEEIFDLMNNKTFLETIQQVNYKTYQKKEEYFQRIMSL